MLCVVMEIVVIKQASKTLTSYIKLKERVF